MKIKLDSYYRYKQSKIQQQRLGEKTTDRHMESFPKPASNFEEKIFIT